MPAKDKDAPLSAEEMLDGETSGLEAAIEAEAVDEAALRAEGIDPNHPVLSIEEQRAAIVAAKSRVEKDSKSEAKKQFEQRIYDEERGRKGLRTGDPRKDELVYVTLDLAEHSDRIVINGAAYLHGQTYKVPRHVADTLREVQARGHDHQNELDGKPLAARANRPRMTTLSERTGAVQNAPQGMV